MTEIEIFLRLLLSFGLGALIGAERERFAKKDDEFVFGGIRTFMFIALLGALSGFIATQTISWFVVPVFAGFVVLIGIGYHSSIKLSKGKEMGVTGEIAGILTFLIGVLVFTNYLFISVALSILIATVLYLKSRLHTFLRKVNEAEMYSTFIFAIITFAVLPFLPNQGYGPFGVLNPFKMWLMVVFISGLSYVGYFLTKTMGSKRGIGLTGLLGGLVSSTATTMSLASKSKEERNAHLVKLFVFAVLVANAVMYVRVLVEVLVVNHDLLQTLIIPMGTMAFVALCCGGYFWLRGGKGGSDDRTSIAGKSPLTIAPALKFGILFGVVLLLVKVAQAYAGQTGVFIASVVSGFVDVDAITLSMAGMAGKELSNKIAATAIVLAVMSNTIIKIGYASIFGSKEFRKRLAWSLALVIVAGLCAVWLL